MKVLASLGGVLEAPQRDRVLRYGWPLLLPLGVAAIAVFGPLFALGYIAVIILMTAFAIMCWLYQSALRVSPSVTDWLSRRFAAGALAPAPSSSFPFSCAFTGGGVARHPDGETPPTVVEQSFYVGGGMKPASAFCKEYVVESPATAWSEPSTYCVNTNPVAGSTWRTTERFSECSGADSTSQKLLSLVRRRWRPCSAQLGGEDETTLFRLSSDV